MARRRSTMLLCATVLVLVTATSVTYVLSPDDLPPAEAPVLQLFSAAPTSVTTTTVPDHTVTTLAVATVAEVAVFAERPLESGSAPPMSFRPASASTIYSPERPGAPPIPTEADAVQGRYKTPEGWAISSPTSLGSAATFVVTEQVDGWVKVLVPVRPNGSEGWVSLAQAQLTTTEFRIDVNVTTRQVTFFDRGTMLLQAPVIVGRSATPTPTGRCFVTDSVDKHVGGAYGSGILASSCFSQVLDRFDNGVPVVALHGTNRPDLLGQATSNGCIRMGEEAITRLRSTVPIGTPIDIHT